MRLPDPLYQHVKNHMQSHTPWHYARFRLGWPDIDPIAWQNAHNLFPKVKYIDEIGAGDEFLQFHRLMLRHFKWIVLNTPGSTYVFQPWLDIPAWLVPKFHPTTFLGAMRAQVANYVAGNSADNLGGYIEYTYPLAYVVGGGVHNMAHGAIAILEAQQHPNHPLLDDAGMAEYSTAHHNEHFWGLHGWIDEFYAQWQRNNGQVVDQSPLDPDDHLAMPPEFMPVHGMPAFTPTESMVGLVRRMFVNHQAPWPLVGHPPRMHVQPSQERPFMPIHKGDRAIEFKLPQKPKDEVDLGQYFGKQPVVLLFFPLAYSSV